MAVISISEQELRLTAPFHPALSLHARALRGRWQPEAKCWTFALDQEEALRARCLLLWGVDGREETCADVVSAEITVMETDVRLPLWRSMEGSIWLLGREIGAIVRGRRAVRPGRGVTFLKGRPVLETRSAVDWISVPDGAVIRIGQVPRMALPHMVAALQGHGSLGAVA